MKKHGYPGFLILLLLSSLVRLLHPASVCGRNLSKPPNIIIIMTDDQGYGELSVHGNPLLKTPHLDRLHDESIRFTDFHVAAMCTPTRGQLMTGLDAVKNGAVNVSSGRTLLRPGIQTMADIFSENGYLTGIFGKWHLGDNYPFRPEDRGFQETVWFPASHIGSVPDYWGNDYFDDIYFNNGRKEQFEGFCTDIFFREAMDFMKVSAKKSLPFFCYLPLNAPHAPFYAPEKDIAEMEEAFYESGIEFPASKKDDFIRYLAMIRNIDHNMGALSKFLNEEDLYNNTIVIFLTDNGSTFGNLYYNAGMRGRKTTPYEGGHRVPFFIRWPSGDLMKPSNIEGLSQVQDILPTLLDLCNIKYENKSFDGMSLADVLQAKANIPEDRTLYINYSRMPLYFDYPSPYSNAKIRESETVVLYKNWRLIDDRELYDLTTDFSQQKNLIEDYPEIANLLRQKRKKWWETVESVANEIVKIPVGNEQENPMKITSCEWMNVLVDMQSQIWKGESKNSYWLLEITEAGTYRFELRRWPEESGLSFNDNIYNNQSIIISAARIYIAQGDQVFSQHKKVKPEDDKVSFNIDLEKGEIALHTWFLDHANNPLNGAYYVSVEKL
jgi:arylsulfatase